MAKLTPAGLDLSDDFDFGELAAAGSSPWYHLKGRGNVALWGAFEATLVIEKSFDGGATAIPCSAGGLPISFDRPSTEVLDEPENGVLYRVTCTEFTSGPIHWRFSR